MTDFIITELEKKIPDISNLATKTALTAVENKIPNVSNLVNKTDYNTKVTEIANKLNNHNHDEYITTPEFNKFSKEFFDARLKRANLVTKVDFDNAVSSLDSKIAINKRKTEFIENKLKESRKGFGFLFLRNRFFNGGDGFQAYLIFQPINKYFKLIAGNNSKMYITSWKSKGLSDESIKPLPTSNNSLTPLIDYYGYKIRVKFNGSTLTQPKVSYTHKKVVNVFIVYELVGSSSHSDDRTLKHCYADIDKSGYSGYGTGFDRKSSFSFPGGGCGQNVLIFGACMSSFDHIDNKKKDILVLGKGQTQGLEHTLTAEKMYSVNFTVTRKKFCLSLHYNRANSYLFVNGKEIVKFKAKDSEIIATPLCLGNISKDWLVDNMKKTRLN